MNRTILSTAAALAVVIVPPVYAGGHSGGGGHFGGGDGGGRGASFQAGGGGRNFSGGARVSGGERSFGGSTRSSFSAPVSRVERSARVQESAVGATQAQSIAARERPSRVEQQFIAQQRNARSVQQQRSDTNRQTPTIAFGGSAARSVDRDVRENQRFQSDARNFNRSDVRSRPPEDVFRRWDRQHIHVWNNHRYHWYNNAWVIFDGGYGYGDPYFYDETPGYTYYQDSPVYDDQSLAPVEYAASDGMATAVQQALAQRGYNPGPIDGAIGQQSRDAIAAFQSDRRMPVTGRIDRALLKALNL